MTSEPLSSCTIRSLSSTGRPFFVHLMSGLGSPPTEQVSITWSATLTVASLSGTDTWGGTEKHSSPHRDTWIHTCMNTHVNIGVCIHEHTNLTPHLTRVNSYMYEHTNNQTLHLIWVYSYTYMYEHSWIISTLVYSYMHENSIQHGCIHIHVHACMHKTSYQHRCICTHTSMNIII